MYSKTPTRYKVRRGDTLSSIAEDFGVPPEKLRSWNRMKGSTADRWSHHKDLPAIDRLPRSIAR